MRIHSVVIPVMANIAQSLQVIVDWERITVADPEEVQGVHPLPDIKYPMKMK